MYDWLSKPKVRLGLLANGLYLLVLLLPSPQPARVRPHAHAFGQPGAAAPRRPPVEITLPPPSGLMKATAYLEKSTGALSVYLEKDLTLLSVPGRRLSVAPIFTVGKNDGAPEYVLLRFISFSDEPWLSSENRLVITADGKQVWPAYTSGGAPVWHGWPDDPAPGVVTDDRASGVVENVGKNIPYEVFARAIAAKSVVVALGPHNFGLTANQLEALRDMHRLLSLPRAEAVRRF
ncbi:MAG TPA: hypothetical protein VF659_08905 [Pyrinomonadaceae bacterium]|jgi:hypothetical protein